MFSLSFCDFSNQCVYPKVPVANESVHVPKEVPTGISRNLWKYFVGGGKVLSEQVRKRARLGIFEAQSYTSSRALNGLAFNRVAFSTNVIAILIVSLHVYVYL